MASVETKSAADVTVVIPAYSMDRWSLTCAAVESVLDQTLLPREIIVCVDHNPELAHRFTERWHDRLGRTPSIRVVESLYDGHQSASRTTGAELATTETLAFLDDDAAADADWLERLLGPLRDPSVIAVGGAPLPVYSTPRPPWFPFEFDWVFGCAYSGLPTTTAPILRLIGTTFAARRKDILAVGGFHFDVFEDMDMSHRLKELSPQSRLIYEPRAIVRHYVPEDRLTWNYFWRRCFWVNRGKVAVMRGLGGAANLRADRSFALKSLSVGVARELREFLNGDIGGLQRALAIFVGLSLATAAYVAGVVEWGITTWRRDRNPFRPR